MSKTARRQLTVRQKPRTKPEDEPERSRSSRSDLWIYLALFLATFLVYVQVRHFEFVNFDDLESVSKNPHVRNGITRNSLMWALTSGDAANWFPLTRFSHLLDYQLFGLQSGWHHLVNVLFHALATLLLFAFLNRATGVRWPSAFVAFLFALHPLHVESVAWVTERKDVLSACFWFLTLWAYVRYAERPGLARYLLVFFSFALGLMAKPMLVTLPFALALLDIWPLQRLSFAGLAVRPGSPGRARILWEKVPFLALSAAAAITTYLVQRRGGAVAAALPLGLRFENALVSYLIYIGKMFWPTGLAVFYPYPLEIPVWQPVLAALTIVGISVFVLRSIRASPYLAMGWFWYLGTLVPVIGLVQVGAQARADRYTYIPMVGLSIMLAWGAADILQRWLRTRLPVAALGVAACTSAAVATVVQTQYWQNSGTLFNHTLNVTASNYIAHGNLGYYLLDIPGRLPEAIVHLEEALRIQPYFAQAHENLGLALSTEGKLPEAIAEFNIALKLRPDSAQAYTDLGNTLSKIAGRLPEAIAQYEAALRIDPNYPEAHNDLGAALSKIPGHSLEAIAEFQAAIRIEHDYAEAHNNLGVALSKLPEHLGQAISEYQAAVKLKPDYAEAQNNLGSTLSKIPGRLSEAISHYEAALRINPNLAEAQYNLGNALVRTGRLSDAISHFETALRIRPDYANAQYSLGITLSKIPGRLPDAIAHFEAAQQIRPDPRLQKMIEQLRNAQR